MVFVTKDGTPNSWDIAWKYVGDERPCYCTSPFWVPACPRLWVLSPRIRPSSSRTRPCPKTTFMMITIKLMFMYQNFFNVYLKCSKPVSLYRTSLSKQCSGFVTLWDGSGSLDPYTGLGIQIWIPIRSCSFRQWLARCQQKSFFFI